MKKIPPIRFYEIIHNALVCYLDELNGVQTTTGQLILDHTKGLKDEIKTTEDVFRNVKESWPKREWGKDRNEWEGMEKEEE